MFYYHRMADFYITSRDYSKAIELASKGYEKSNGPGFLRILGTCYFWEGRYKESLEYFEPYIEAMEELGLEDLWTKPQIAYVYMKNGFPEKANFFIEKQIAQSELWIENNVNWADGQYIFLSHVYGMRGDKEKALENLKLAYQRWGETAHVMEIRDYALFEKIRNEPEFQEIVLELIEQVITNQVVVEQELLATGLVPRGEPVARRGEQPAPPAGAVGAGQRIA